MSSPPWKLRVIVPVLAALVFGCAAPIRTFDAKAPSRLRLSSECPPNEPKNQPTTPSEPTARPAKPWHLEIGLHDSYTKLAETKRLLDRRLEIPLRFDVLDVFHHPDTPLDRKSDLTLTSFYLGMGRQESDWLVWSLYAGGGGGGNHTHQRFINANLEVSFRYVLAYTGIIAEWYPWRVPHPSQEMDWSQRISASRPFVLAGVETGYVSGEGRGHYSLAPFRIYEDHAKIRDWITSFNLGLGWAVPLDDRWSVNVSGDYRFHFYRPDEYDSWVLSLGLRYRLAAPRQSEEVR